MTKRAVITWTAGLVIAVGLATTTVWLFASGTVKVTLRGSDATAPTNVVCGDEIVRRYNEANLYIQREGQEQPSVDEEAKKAIANEVKALKGSENDPTCQVIIFWAARDAADKVLATQTYEKIKSLHESGRFADNNLRAATSLTEYDSMVKLLDTDAQTVNIEGLN
jgi:hypothetical protein